MILDLWLSKKHHKLKKNLLSEIGVALLMERRRLLERYVGGNLTGLCDFPDVKNKRKEL